MKNPTQTTNNTKKNHPKAKKNRRKSGFDFHFLEQRGGFVSSALTGVLFKCRVSLKWFIQKTFTDPGLHVWTGFIHLEDGEKLEKTFQLHNSLPSANCGLTYFMGQVIKFSQQFLYLPDSQSFCNNSLLKYSRPFQKDPADRKGNLFPWLFIPITQVCTSFLVW